ncbi:MAG: RNA polymerase sigma factor [Coriobacteriales bacterium]|nr:RNA polymerase sigma factor [Coriobacteriales bacterium]
MAHADCSTTEQFVDVYQRHVDTVYRVCYTFLRNAADTEDAVQNVFIKLLATPRAFENAEHEKAWLIRVASNHCKDVLKSIWSKRTDLESIAEPPAPEESPDETLTVVMSLPEAQRVCIYLYYYEGYKAAEIASFINRSHSTVRSYLSEARASLRKRLGGGFDG